VNDNRDTRSKPGRRLPSIFDGVPPDTPLPLEEIEERMEADLQRRMLLALDRAFAAKPNSQPSEPDSPR
jgi:hypothetical protein